METTTKNTNENESIDDVNDETTKLLMKHVLGDGYYMPDYAPTELEELPLHPVVYSSSVPEVNWHKYIDRVYQYSEVSNMVFICALILIEKANIQLSVYNTHRFLISSVCLSAKACMTVGMH